MLQHLINHISLIVDKSSSMAGQPVVKVFDKELNYLKQRSVELNQETRISIYLFNHDVSCLVFDMDVMRFNTLEGYWKPSGMTALLDGIAKSIDDNRQLPTFYGDHAFLQYVITDGQENRSIIRAADLKSKLGSLPENWTTACLVPDQNGRYEAKKFGLNDDSIAIWDTSAVNAFEKVGTQFSQTIDSYMAMRSSGIRGTTGLFALDSSGLKKSVLKELPSDSYEIFPVTQDAPIREYLEQLTGSKYRLGTGYYEPIKKVTIQDYKNVLVQNKKDNKVYEGQNLRQLLGLPNSTVDVDPGAHKDWRIFVQSTSTNRKLFAGTSVLLAK